MSFRHAFACVIVSLCLATFVGVTNACTTVVVSGRVTVDGRPLLWKNRDFWQRQNELLHDDSGRFAWVGIANAEATRRIRMGVNTAGLCVENSVSRDLAGEARNGPANGDLIRIALESCANIPEFITLLEETNITGRRTRGNFGLIDAEGNAMLFEVGPDAFRKWDANDPGDAPQGFVVRSNFSETARERLTGTARDLENVYSGERYQRAYELCAIRLRTGKLDARYLMNAVARDVGSCERCRTVGTPDPSNIETPPQINTSSTLNRNLTVSAAVFQGVKPGESPALTTMWAMLGEPMFTVAVPCWAHQAGVAPVTNGDGASPLCLLSTKLRQAHYDRTGKRLRTEALDPMTGRLKAVEGEIYELVQTRLREWREDPPQHAELRRTHELASAKAFATLTSLASRLVMTVGTEGAPEPVGIDFRFDESDSTKLAETENAAGSTTWDGGMTDCTVVEGSFRIRRNSSKTVTRYVELPTKVRVRYDDDRNPKTNRGWLVIEIAGWNLRGKTPNELVRFGFTSRAEKDLHTAALSLSRTEEGVVKLEGLSFGDGGTPITIETTLPMEQKTPIVFALELDKMAGNPDEGETGGQYRIFCRKTPKGSFEQLGGVGKVRRLRNGNHVHFRTAGYFAARDEYFDIDRLYFTTENPIGK